jgi:hypothetical protein
MGLQSCRSSNFKNFETPNLIDNIIREKVVASQRLGHGESCESVCACGSFMHQKCFNYALANLLSSLCRFVWIIDSFVTRPSPHLRASTRPFYSSKCCELGNVSSLFLFCCFHFWTCIWILKGVLECVKQSLKVLCALKTMRRDNEKQIKITPIYIIS